MVNVGAALFSLTTKLQPLIVDKIREEIITTYRQAADHINVGFLECKPGQKSYEYSEVPPA